MEPLLMKPAEVMRELRTGRSKTYEMIATGELPSVKVGRNVRVPRAALKRWIQENQTGQVGIGAQEERDE